MPQKPDDWPSLEKIVAYQSLVRERIRKVYSAGGGIMTMRLARIMFMVSRIILSEIIENSS